MGFAGCQPTSRISERPCIMGIESDGAGHLTFSSGTYVHTTVHTCAHTLSTHTHTHKRKIIDKIARVLHPSHGLPADAQMASSDGVGAQAWSATCPWPPIIPSFHLHFLQAEDAHLTRHCTVGKFRLTVNSHVSGQSGYFRTHPPSSQGKRSEPSR